MRLMSLLYEYMLIQSDEKQGQDAGVNYPPGFCYQPLSPHQDSREVLGYPGKAVKHTLERPTVSSMCMFLPREKVNTAIFYF